MSKEIFTWIRYASMLSTLPALIVFFIYWKIQPRQNRILFISLFISLTFDLIGWSLIKSFDPWSTNISNNIYSFIAFPVIMLFYHEILVKRTLKIVARIFTIVFLIVAMISTMDQGLNVMNTFCMTLSSVLVAITSFFFVADLNLMDTGDFAKNPFHKTNIILNTSLAIYYFATIIIFAVSEYMYSHLSLEDSRFVWASHNATHILKNAGLAVAFYLSAKRSVALGYLQKS